MTEKTSNRTVSLPRRTFQTVSTVGMFLLWGWVWVKSMMRGDLGLTVISGLAMIFHPAAMTFWFAMQNDEGNR